MKTLSLAIVISVITFSVIYALHNHWQTSYFLKKFAENYETHLEEQSLHRRLAAAEEEEITIKGALKRPRRMEKFKKLLKLAESSIPTNLPMKFLTDSFPLNPKKSAIITCAFASTYQPRDVTQFLGTARRAGVQSNIIVAILPTADKKFVDRLLKYNATIYVADMKCTEDKHNSVCTTKGGSEPGALPVTLVRFYYYIYLSSLLSPSVNVMISDFRDVYFQLNPFASRYVVNLLKSPNDLMVFQESHPNKVMNRDPQMLGWLAHCYGEDMIKHLGFNLVSTSGVVMGIRSAITAYAWMITTQIDAQNRQFYNTSTPIAASKGNNDLNKQCFSMGVDQGFHNVLLYAHIFSKYLDVRVFPQGEGPVNNIGGYFGEKKLLRAYLSEWKILRGESPFKYIYNWNGELSPVVHQLDRFLNTELQGGYEAHMAAFHNIYN